MTSTRAVRRLIGSAAVATATAGVAVAAGGLTATPASTSAYQLCEQVILSGDFNHTFGSCVNEPEPTFCTPQTFGLEPTQDVTVYACIVD